MPHEKVACKPGHTPIGLGATPFRAEKIAQFMSFHAVANPPFHAVRDADPLGVMGGMAGGTDVDDASHPVLRDSLPHRRVPTRRAR